MLTALAERFPQDEWRAFAPGRAPLPTVPPGVRLIRHHAPSRLVFGGAAAVGRPRLDRLTGGADVVWLPAPAPAAISAGTPYVLTLHDLTWIERPEDFTRYERAWHAVARLERQARGAAAVVCVSAATRDTALRVWPRLDATRVRVVHPGVTDVADGGTAPAGLPERFLLHVGALEPRKDPLLLADAFARARAQGLDAELVFAGDGRLAGQLRGRAGVHVLGRVADTGALYARAAAVAMPSRLEGFGLPPLEAALHGTPAVVSDLPVFAETLGDTALRVPAWDVDAWAQALLAVVGRDATAARERASRLTWAAAADGLHAVLEEVGRP